MSHAIERALRLQRQLRNVFESNLGGAKDLSTSHRMRLHAILAVRWSEAIGSRQGAEATR